MTRSQQIRVLAVLVAAAVGLCAEVVTAQAYSYPSLQLPTVSTRDYTAAIVGATGTTALFQWRERITQQMHVSLDAGLADPAGNSNLLIFAAGNLGRQLVRANGDQPLDVLFTGGLGVSLGGSTRFLRVPIGVSVGHRFGLDGGFALTPYVHPRISLDVCGRCGAHNDNNSELSLNFDVGVNFEVNSKFAVRLAGAFSGSELLGKNDAFAIGIAWTPAALATH